MFLKLSAMQENEKTDQADLSALGWIYIFMDVREAHIQPQTGAAMQRIARKGGLWHVWLTIYIYMDFRSAISAIFAEFSLVSPCTRL